MDGAHAMSMAWAPGAGASWPGAAFALAAGAAAFEVTWLAMMGAMMAPSLVPMLWHYRGAVRATSATGRATLTALVATGYFAVWAAIGAAIFLLGAWLGFATRAWPSLARLAPVATGVVVLAAGVFQFSAWKARHLPCCRARAAARRFDARVATAWRHGVRLGGHCAADSAGVTAVLLAVGMMDLRVMAAATAAIAAQRLAPAGDRLARLVGALGVCAGLGLLARAATIG